MSTRDNVSEFSEDEQEYEKPDNEREAHVTLSPFYHNFHCQVLEESEFLNRYENTSGTNNPLNELWVGKLFESKEATEFAIKQFHIDHSFDFVVEKSRFDKYISRCTKYDNGYEWWIRASFSKFRNKWEIKKINGVHTCITSIISQDHHKLDSNVIASHIHGLVNENPSIPIKKLIVEIQTYHGYTRTYKKAWLAKQKEKYHGTLLTAITQDDNQNLFPLAFTIVKGETKEAWVWFLHYLKVCHITIKFMHHIR
uniref:MULE transposase domain-containing protein n=1 Tax=Cajanus cajan TaxID=3821 RepID=A0A151SQQ9_CAJCA|nr:hypothetical protein KK1_003425 [Cajanus cajan]KYP57181.1 hypothetical protein KK1_003439 [Cajanus cajan]